MTIMRKRFYIFSGRATLNRSIREYIQQVISVSNCLHSGMQSGAWLVAARQHRDQQFWSNIVEMWEAGRKAMTMLDELHEISSRKYESYAPS